MKSKLGKYLGYGSWYSDNLTIIKQTSKELELKTKNVLRKKVKATTVLRKINTITRRMMKEEKSNKI